MITFAGRCPHCSSDRGFVAFGRSEYIIGEHDYSATPAKDREILEKKRKDNPLVEFSLAGSCQFCKKPIVATCKSSYNIYKEIFDVLKDPFRTFSHIIDVVEIFPSPVQPYAHPSLPDEVCASFIDLQKMILEKKRPHFIISGCRMVLEASVKELGGNGKNLYACIEDLHSKGIITTSLKEWASIIRKFGNEATHEMKGEPEEARELVDFTKVFLQFTFELPATIAALQSTNP